MHRSARARRGLVLVAALLVLSSCGADDESRGGAPAPGNGAFPVTVEHKFGATTVSSTPRRIAIVGLTEQDTVLALGHKPIATTEWYGKQPYAVWPWAKPALGDAKGSTEWFSPWDQQTELIAKALGKEAEGRALVRKVEARYAKAAAQHPEFKGKTITFSQNGFYDGSVYVYPAGLNTEFLTYLGFSINPKVTALATKRGEQVPVSAERLDVLDADVILFATEKPRDIGALEKVPTFSRLEAVAEHRAVFTDGVLTGAAYFTTPLSLPYLLDRLTPQLQSAVAGKAPRRIVDTMGG